MKYSGAERVGSTSSGYPKNSVMGKPAEIPQLVSGLEKTSDELSMTVEQLITRLVAITRSSEEKESGLGTPRFTPSTEIGGRIENSTNSITNNIRKISDLMSHLEV